MLKTTRKYLFYSLKKGLKSNSIISTSFFFIDESSNYYCTCRFRWQIKCS